MNTIYLDISIPRILLTRLLGRFSTAAYFASTSPLHFDALPDPALPADNWVRVRNRMCGICGSDLHQLFVDAGLDVAPVALPAHKRIYLGHEMVGEIVEMGPKVFQFQPGQRVVRWGRADDCLARGRTELCPPCQRGHRVLCQHASEPRQHTPLGGGFGDSFITPAATLLPVPDELSDEQAIFTEPLAVAIHAATRRPAQPGEQILVLGVGTIGFLLIQTIRVLQPDCQITAVAQFPWQARIARQLGADRTISTSETTYKTVTELTSSTLYEGRSGNQMIIGGFDAIFDCVGIPQTLNDALRWTRANGTVVLVGVNLHRMKIDLTPVWHQEVDLIGAIGHDIVNWQGEQISTFDLAMRWMSQEQIKTEPLLTHRFPLHQYRKAFDTAVNKTTTQSIKVAFDL